MSVPYDFEAVMADGKVVLKTFRSWGVGDKQQYASCCSQQLVDEYNWARDNGTEIEPVIGFRFYWEGVLCNFNWKRTK
jgi:hypothetical protein